MCRTKKRNTEDERLSALYQTGLLDTEPEEDFDMCTDTVARVLDVPICLVSLVDANRQWFKSKHGLDACETHRDIAFCAHAIKQKDDLLFIEDTLQDERFKDNPLVIDAPYIRSYAGVVLRSPDKFSLGTLCAIDTKPRQYSASDIQLLRSFASLIEHHIYKRMQALHGGSWQNFIVEIEEEEPLLTVSQFDNKAQDICLDPQYDGLVAGAIDLPKIRNVARNYGQQVANECLAEIRRRFHLTMLNREYMLGRCVLNQYAFLTRLDKKKDSLKQLEKDISLNFGNRVQTNSQTVFTPVLVGLSDVAEEETLPYEALQERARMAVDLLNRSEPGLHIGLYDKESCEVHERLTHIVKKLPDAIENKQINVFYQPKVQLSDYSICGVEALMRWTDVDIGVISPLEVLTVAESLELLKKLDLYIIDTAIKQKSQWESVGLVLPSISINISETTLMADNLLEKLSTILDKYESPSGIDLEILESSLLADSKAVISRMKEILSLGFTFSLDDFGTGFSSLSQLRQIPIDTLKIDRSFIQNMIGNVKQSALAHKIIGIGHTQNVKVVAEGVERFTEQVVLKSFGCDIAQGYYFSKPLPAEELAALIESTGGKLIPKDGDDFI